MGIEKIVAESGLFDDIFYIKTYRDVRLSSLTPLEHYCRHGVAEDRKPNAEFDPSWYREYYADVKEAGVYPFLHFLESGRAENRFQNEAEKEEYEKLENDGFDVEFYKNSYENLAKITDENFDFILHYIRHGKFEGRNINFSSNDLALENEQDIKSKFGPILHNPLVSIISVNFNGSKDLPVFLESLSKQSYRNFELIIVDNGSKDNSKEIVNQYKESFKELKYIETNQNLGFAAGNNYALPYCQGELLSLLNIDTRVDEDWLKELVAAMSQDGSCAAVASKTLFFERFQDIEMSAENEFSIELKPLLESLTYKKYFIRNGVVKDDTIISSENKIVISLPVQERLLQVVYNSQSRNISGLSIKVGKNRAIYHKIVANTLQAEVDFSLNTLKNASYIVNNAGSTTKNNMPADRGIGEYDNGQYDSKCYVDFVCGVSVLLRRSAILDRKIFVSEFFAYYEDSELSRWIRENGYTILYAPRSILYHQHSATSSEGSPLWSLLVARSQQIYKYDGDFNTLYNTINHLEEHFKPNVNENVYKELKTFSATLRARLKKQNNIVETLKPIAIYNSYWNTKGGGESHALSFAKVLQKYETVYLVSEDDFSIDELSSYYDLDLSNCRKIIEPYMTSDFTKKFDIFINSTYQSNLVSLARNSFYIVYFPQKNIDSNVLNSYTFLYMNDYTKDWGIKYWGEAHKWDIVCPLGMLNAPKQVVEHALNKEKIILSVGRFFVGGHSKKQDVIAKAFKELCLNNQNVMDGWKLVLIGSLDYTQKSHVKYVDEIHTILDNTNYEIIVNSKRENLEEYYKKAYIYIHASGFGIDAELAPEKIEHFGITPIEAMQKGCYPIVYDIGGPKETLEKSNIGLAFHTINDLKKALLVKIENYEIEKDSLYESVIQSITSFIHENNPDNKINGFYISAKEQQ